MQKLLRNLSRKKIDFTADKAGGSNILSFENRRKEIEPRSPPKLLTPHPVEDVPIDVNTDDYKVDADERSSTFPLKFIFHCLTVDGYDYPSVEQHYYQACKLYTLGGARLRNIPDLILVWLKFIQKKLLHSANVSVEKIEEWKYTQGPVLLHHAMVHKFASNPELHAKLLETGNACLYIHTNRITFLLRIAQGEDDGMGDK